ncbi:MAG: diguanylate cyclase [Rhodoferax sp.]|nr:diguanylate cyclase [Rhodoferax sp.]
MARRPRANASRYQRPIAAARRRAGSPPPGDHEGRAQAPLFCADRGLQLCHEGPRGPAEETGKHHDRLVRCFGQGTQVFAGYEVCRRLKADTALRDIPVIFVTADTDETSEARALDAGAVDFITKPVNPRIVRARVKTHLTLKAQSDLLRQWVYTDGLTGVRNRRYFDERLQEECGRARRDQSDLSVLILDVDFFKRFNDRYGHQAGDECLRQVASALKGGPQRQGDVIARYGGEEFVCLLPNCALEGAMHLAETLCRQVRVQHIAHADSSVAPVVTTSVGVCSASGRAEFAADVLVGGADAQLYVAKSLGRNQTSGARLADASRPPAPASTSATGATGA